MSVEHGASQPEAKPSEELAEVVPFERQNFSNINGTSQDEVVQSPDLESEVDLHDTERLLSQLKHGNLSPADKARLRRQIRDMRENPAGSQDHESRLLLREMQRHLVANTHTPGQQEDDLNGASLGQTRNQIQVGAGEVISIKDARVAGLNGAGLKISGSIIATHSFNAIRQNGAFAPVEPVEAIVLFECQYTTEGLGSFGYRSQETVLGGKMKFSGKEKAAEILRMLEHEEQAA